MAQAQRLLALVICATWDCSCLHPSHLRGAPVLQGIFLLSPLSSADSGLMSRPPGPSCGDHYGQFRNRLGTEPANNKALENNHIINGICFISMEALKMRQQRVGMLALRSARLTKISQARPCSGTAEFTNDTIKTFLFHPPVLLFFVSWLISTWALVTEDVIL